MNLACGWQGYSCDQQCAPEGAHRGRENELQMLHHIIYDAVIYDLRIYVLFALRANVRFSLSSMASGANNPIPSNNQINRTS